MLSTMLRPETVSACEQEIASALGAVADELRLVDAAELVMLVRSGATFDLCDIISSASELHFHEGSLTFTGHAETALAWGGSPTVWFDLECVDPDLTVLFRLGLGAREASIELLGLPGGLGPEGEARLAHRIRRLLALARR